MSSDAAYQPDVSVVINTLNRASILPSSVLSLRYQDYPRFEVIVVDGPSTDGTGEVLARYGDDIKLRHVPVANLSQSRNAGIAAAAGEIVLFLDDDALAEPGWISNIVAAYQDPRVGGAGTRVWDHLGFTEQKNPRLIDEFYNPIFEARSPVWAFHYRDSRTIPHILGASSSFRRDLLLNIGGFDEEIEYYLDESEVCRRIAELGYEIRFLEGGPAVHHKYAAGVVRDQRKLLTHPYPVVKNKYYACLADASRHRRPLQEAMDAGDKFAGHLLEEARHNLKARTLSPKEFDRFNEDLSRGVRDGRIRGLRAARKSGSFGASPEDFRLFPKIQPPGRARSFCFICRHLPQRSPGGVARFIYDLAVGFAAMGHRVILIAEAFGHAEIVYQDGIWLHQINDSAYHPASGEVAANFESTAALANFRWSAAVHAEVRRIASDRVIDLVVSPLWNTEGLHCVFDQDLKTVVALQTTFKTYSEIEWQHLDTKTTEELLLLEQLLLEGARHVHAISHAISEQVGDSYAIPRGPGWVVAHLGVEDVKVGARREQENEAKVNILYVSRLEKRKGTDVFLTAVTSLLRDHPDLWVDVIGRDTSLVDLGSSYEAMTATMSPDQRGRIVFRGEVDDRELRQAYADADIFCVPSRFESFGLIYLEAMRAGKPVVACDVGGIPEIVMDGATGFLVEPGNAPALTEALRRLINDASLRSQMSKASRQRYEQEFTREKMIARTLALYEAMIDD